ncbi:MAG TPA: type I restriction-modification enzyme R subunit C-terminal domain-containing protein [Opitutaceae bacterium]|nr:type I restriction-modification enzyme R subunit C-terminal domain-containing protein [Opitutaceae bacterium]
MEVDDMPGGISMRNSCALQIRSERLVVREKPEENLFIPLALGRPDFSEIVRKEGGEGDRPAYLVLHRRRAEKGRRIVRVQFHVGPAQRFHFGSQALRPASAKSSARSAFTSGRASTVNQIEFVSLVVDYLTARGAMKPELLYETPFTDMSPQGPDGVLNSAQVDELLEILSQIRARATA